jgi:hypothetical protein
VANDDVECSRPVEIAHFQESPLFVARPRGCSHRLPRFLLPFCLDRLLTLLSNIRKTAFKFGGQVCVLPHNRTGPVHVCTKTPFRPSVTLNRFLRLGIKIRIDGQLLL